MKLLSMLSAVSVLALTTASFGADLPSKKAPVSLAYASPINWTGFYVGVQIGAAQSQSELSGSDFYTATFKPTWNAFFGGVHAGYDYQISRFVVGLEGDINARSGKNSYVFSHSIAAIPYGWESKSTYDASIRARLGYLVTDNALIYATGGVAFQNFKFANTIAPGDADWGYQNLYGGSRTGWTLGAGAQYAVTQNWSANVEYRYSAYGTKSTYIGGPYSDKAKLSDNRVTVGLSYKFGGPSTVVAKY